MEPETKKPWWGRISGSGVPPEDGRWLLSFGFFFFFTVIQHCIFSFTLLKHLFVNRKFSFSFLYHFWSWCIYILVILTVGITFWTTQAAEQRIFLICWIVCFWWCFRLWLIHKRNTGFLSFQLPHHLLHQMWSLGFCMLSWSILNLGQEDHRAGLKSQTSLNPEPEKAFLMLLTLWLLHL